jgi:hypothetical protein
MLCGVTALMRYLGRPVAADALARLLAQSEVHEVAADGGNRHSSNAAVSRQQRDEADDFNPVVNVGDKSWSGVKDNAPFLSAEKAAWFSLLASVRDQGTEAQAARVPEATYAQLVSQPEAYRGRLVRVRGTVLRESLKRAPANELGMAEYHQLFLAPKGGGELPVVAYALELPAEFPRGGDIHEAVAIDGLFFKVWSFADEAGMALAPVLVAQSLHWQPAAAVRPAKTSEPTSHRWLPGLVAAAAIAGLLVAWVMWQTARPRREVRIAVVGATRARVDDENADEMTRLNLQQLADAEGEP